MNIFSDLLALLKINKQPDKVFKLEDVFSYSSVIFNIMERKYDINKIKDVKKIPIAKISVSILGNEYGIDYLLREKDRYLYKNQIDIELASACISKSNEITFHGFGTKSKEEIEHKLVLEKHQKDKEKELQLKLNYIYDRKKDLLFKPYTWYGDIVKGAFCVWFQLNLNNKYTAIKDISYLNTLMYTFCLKHKIRQELFVCTEEISYDYPKHITLNSLPETYIECNQYTATGNQSKYPLILHFTAHETIYRTLDTGAIYYLPDGNIGKADINCIRGIHRYLIQFRLSGLELIPKRLDETDNTTGKTHTVKY